LRALAERRGIPLIADACHALGATCAGRPVGVAADMTVFSFHPVKHITTGEGGMALTHTGQWAHAMRRFRNHGIDVDANRRMAKGAWSYEVVELGYNYRITDIQCALGRSQLGKLPHWLARRRTLARQYDEALAALPGVTPLACLPGREHAYHLYVVRIDAETTGVERDTCFRGMRERGIGVNVHYRPVHLHPFYRQRFGYGPGLCPNAERAEHEVLSLPMWPGLTDADLAHVVEALRLTITCPQ